MTGNVSDFIIYDELFHMSAGEQIAQRVDAFNGALTQEKQGGSSRIAGLRLSARALMGESERHTLYKRIPGLIQERDPYSNAPVADSKLEHLEHVGIKLNRRIGPIKGTLDQFRKIGQSSETFSVEIGRQVGDEIFEDYLNTALTAGIAALRNTTVAASNIASDTAAKVSPAHLNDGRRKMGDSLTTALLIMNSGAYFDLIASNNGVQGDRLYQVSDVSIREGIPATGGSPILVTDSPSLSNVAGDENYILGLVEGGITVTESEGRIIEMDKVLGEENLGRRIQGEGAFNLDIMGFAWDLVNGGTNPNAAAAGNPANWGQYATSHKHVHGYLIEAAA